MDKRMWDKSGWNTGPYSSVKKQIEKTKDYTMICLKGRGDCRLSGAGHSAILNAPSACWGVLIDTHRLFM